MPQSACNASLPKSYRGKRISREYGGPFLLSSARTNAVEAILETRVLSLPLAAQIVPLTAQKPKHKDRKKAQLALRKAQLQYRKHSLHASLNYHSIIRSSLSMHAQTLIHPSFPKLSVYRPRAGFSPSNLFESTG